jgi:hypothetical protein
MSANRHSIRARRAIVGLLTAGAFAALALLSTGPPRADATGERVVPRGGFYQGVTSQGRQCSYGSDLRCLVTFKVRNGVAKNGTFELRLPFCTVKFWVYDTDRVNRRTGRFELEATSAEIRGRFVSRRFVRGTVYGESSGGCGSKTVRFTAHPK